MKAWLTIPICLLCFFCRAQEVPGNTQQQLEDLGDEFLEDDAFLQHLEFYRKHPLNLNTATAKDLEPLRFLSELQLSALIRHRSLFGKLISIYELQAIPGFDLVTINKIRPFVFIGPAETVRENFLSRFRNGSKYALLRYTRVLERSAGYDTSRTTYYLGTPDRLMFRYVYQYKNQLYYGVVADKDAGEQFFKGPQKTGFDFYSAHFFARDLGKIKALAVGDYTVNLGQGLTQWQSLAFGKSVEVMNIKRQLPVLMPYRSAGEFLFNRGAAITIGGQKWEGTAFVSSKKFTGNLDTDSVERFTSFGTSGYHRTKNEMADRNRITDFSFGGNLTYRGGLLKLGANLVSHRFSLPMQKRSEPYNQFAFSGNQAMNASIDYSYTYNNVHMFGEVASDRKGNRALLQGLLASLDRKVDFSLLYRNISKGYQNLFGNAFTENTLPVNEKGVYAGLLIRPTTGWQLATYADFYTFDFLRYRVSAPSRGWDYLGQITYTPSKKAELYLRYRAKNKPLDESWTPSVMDSPVDQVRKNLRLNFSAEIQPKLTIRGRTELIWFRSGMRQEEGFLAFLEGNARVNDKFSGNVQLQYFETGSYDSRIYVYENDVLYSFSIPAFYDKGLRYYLNLKTNIFRNCTLWVRFAQTIYADRQSIGSGLDEIPGNRRSEIRGQIKWGF